MRSSQGAETNGDIVLKELPACKEKATHSQAVKVKDGGK